MRSASYNLAALFFLGGCSVINSFDDVKGAVAPGSGGNANGSGGDNGNGGTSTGGSGGLGGAAAGGLGGATGGKGGGAGGPITDSGADVFVPGGKGGILVAYDRLASPAKPALVVVDPVSGKELSSEPIGAVKGILNDGLTDLWYIFEQPGKPTDPVNLHVRELRTTDGAWHEIGTVASVPQPTSRIAALNGQVVYLSTPTTGSIDPATFTLTILDVSDPTHVTIFGGAANATRPLPPGRKQSILGRPKTGATGGTIDVLNISSACTVTDDGGVPTCPTSLTAYSVGANSSFSVGATKVIGKVLSTGTARIERDAKLDAVVVAFPARPAASDPGCITDLTTVTDHGSVAKFGPLDFSGLQAPVDYPIESESVTGTAYDACLDTMFIATQNFDHGIWAIPLSSGTATQEKQCRGTGAASLLFEPYTRTVIRVPTGGGTPEFLSITGAATAPHLKSITLNSLRPTFAPLVMGARQPPGYTQNCAGL